MTRIGTELIAVTFGYRKVFLIRGVCARSSILKPLRMFTFSNLSENPDDMDWTF